MKIFIINCRQREIIHYLNKDLPGLLYYFVLALDHVLSVLALERLFDNLLFYGCDWPGTGR